MCWLSWPEPGRGKSSRDYMPGGAVNDNCWAPICCCTGQASRLRLVGDTKESRCGIVHRLLDHEAWGWLELAVSHSIASVQHGGPAGLHACFRFDLKCRRRHCYWQYEGSAAVPFGLAAGMQRVDPR
eukprot:4609199-Alexandrium_andersonii.AAC.1